MTHTSQTVTPNDARSDAHPKPSHALRDAAHRAGQGQRGSTPVVITIDGPAGTGKSSVAHRLAGLLGLDVLDTGAMYRAAAAIFIDKRFRKDQVGEFISEVMGADLHFDWTADPPVILAWDDPYDKRIRATAVTGVVSWVASLAELRAHMVRKQRVIFAQHPRLVTEGRDQGSVVFPDAPVKFYLHAEPGVRAKRRADQHRADGRTDVDEGALRRQIEERDRLDSSRADGPLVRPDDAEVIDTSALTLDAVVELLHKCALAKLPSLAEGGPVDPPVPPGPAGSPGGQP